MIKPSKLFGDFGDFIVESYKERLRWKLTKCAEVQLLVEALEKIATGIGSEKEPVRSVSDCRRLAFLTLKKYQKSIE